MKRTLGMITALGAMLCFTNPVCAQSQQITLGTDGWGAPLSVEAVYFDGRKTKTRSMVFDSASTMIVAPITSNGAAVNTLQSLKVYWSNGSCTIDVSASQSSCGWYEMGVHICVFLDYFGNGEYRFNLMIPLGG